MHLIELVRRYHSSHSSIQERAFPGGGGGVFIFRGKFERGGGQEEVNYKFNLF